MIALVLLVGLFHTSHRADVIKATESELGRAAATVGDYQRNPPMLTAAQDDAMYILRAEADISIAQHALRGYKRHQLTEQDLRSSMAQLERDLEDLPPAPAVVKDSRPTI